MSKTTQRTLPRMEHVPIGDLVPNPWNTNHLSPEHEAKLDASLKRFGVFKPIVVRTIPGGQLEILGGQHRWEAAKRLGYVEVPVANLGIMVDETAKEIGLVDNGRYGDDDPLALAALIRELGVEDVTTFLPYSDEDLQNLFAAESISLDDLDADKNELPELPPATNAGPTHQIVRFKVPVEDCAWIQALLDREMKSNGFTQEDSMTNAGNALVSIAKKYRDSLMEPKS